MSIQAEREYALRVKQSGLYRKPYATPRVLREFAIALDILQRHARRGTVLDLGCGPGWTSLFLARAGYEVTGVDVAERMIEIAQERAASDGLDVDFRVADVETLNLEKRDYDAAVIFDALHHCPGYRDALTHVASHLRPGGVLVVMEPSWLHRYSPHAREEVRKHGVTELGFTRWELRRALRAAGFSRVANYYDPGPACPGLLGFLKGNLRLWAGYWTGFPQIKQIVVAWR